MNRFKMARACENDHYWRKPHWYQYVSAGQQGAGTNVPEPDPVGTLVPARHPNRH